MEDNKMKFPGGLFERIWIVCLVTGIFLKLINAITWGGFLVVIFIWPLVVLVFVIVAIILVAKEQKGDEDGKDS